MAETAADNSGVPGLVDALSVFIKQERAKVKEIESTLNKHCKDDNSSWAGKYPIQIHSSIATWKAKRDNGRQMQYKCQAVQCAFEWQKSEDGWRRDHVWVQKYLIGSTNSQRIPYPWQNRMIGELQLVHTVKDESMAGEIGCTQILKYTGALVKLLRWRRRGIVNLIHGMVEVEP